MTNQPHCLTTQALATYQARQPLSLHKHIDRLHKTMSTAPALPFLIASAVHSCKIESNPLSLAAYYQMRNTPQLAPAALTQIDNLLDAYHYARSQPLTEANLLTAHQLLMGNSPYGGQYRQQQATVLNRTTGQLVYQAASPTIIKPLMATLLTDVTTLSQQALPLPDAFYFASLLHLWLARIHPFGDGNGRLARLVETWFLAHQLGDVAWRIQSAHAYYRRQASYYQRLNLGPTYTPLQGRAYVPFLLLLPWSLREKVSWVLNAESAWLD